MSVEAIKPSSSVTLRSLACVCQRTMRPPNEIRWYFSSPAVNDASRYGFPMPYSGSTSASISAGG
jgi:hypothetical protein